ncbi:hypothetical protein CMO94_00435 [Candidatus Woesearchaeota archaeon]|jgi:hypothetical protein|nr:hypothetical protein [Candidatus Woesearchaeota archaeon]|tara:strand:+ start:220 stop:729 length:510 start_codon:yes stop_codon:yes gene_type:complete
MNPDFTENNREKLLKYVGWGIGGIVSFWISKSILLILGSLFSFIINQFYGGTFLEILISGFSQGIISIITSGIFIGLIVGLIFKHFIDKKYIKSNFIFVVVFGIIVGILNILYSIVPFIINYSGEQRMIAIQLFFFSLLGFFPVLNYIIFGFLILYIGRFFENKLKKYL